MNTCKKIFSSVFLTLTAFKAPKTNLQQKQIDLFLYCTWASKIIYIKKKLHKMLKCSQTILQLLPRVKEMHNCVTCATLRQNEKSQRLCIQTELSEQWKEDKEGKLKGNY